MKRTTALLLALPLALGLTACGDSLDEDEAIASCQVNVKNKLKNPGSADFPYGSATAVSTGEKSYTVSGSGRGENSFGGTAAFTYDCSVRKDSSGDVWVTSTLTSN